MTEQKLSDHRISKKTIVIDYGVLLFALIVSFKSPYPVTVSIVLGTLLFFLLTGLFWFAVEFDGVLNRWIDHVDFEWTNYFTTGHYLTWLYLQDRNAWLSVVVLLLLPLSVSLASMMFNPTTGVVLCFFCVLLNFVTVVAVHKR
jgi:hypothetical protein